MSLYTAIAEGSQASQWNHTSLDAETAVYYAAAFNSREDQKVVQIDRSKVPEEQIRDVSDSTKFAQQMPSHYSTSSPTHHFAVKHRVVVVSGHVPADAIVAVHDVPRGLPRGLPNCSLQDYLERLMRFADANKIEQWKFEGALKLFNEVKGEALLDRNGRYPEHVRAAADAVRWLREGTRDSAWNAPRVRD